MANRGSKAQRPGKSAAVPPGRRAPRPPGPAPLKQRSIVQRLHRQILSGRLEPGARLPTRRELCDRLGVSLVTVQQALDELARDGFVEARGASGTFVAQRPPHLCTYGLVFPQRPNSPGFVRFWTALANEALAMSRDDRRIVPWFGIDGHADSEDFQRLVHDVQRRRMAGLIFASRPYNLAHTPLLTERHLPRVAVASSTRDMGDVQALELDNHSFITRALDHLVQRRRTRVAILHANSAAAWHEQLDQALEQRRLTSRPYWRIGLWPAQPQSARAVAHLLLNPDQRQRPDALVITDDNLVEHATAGMIDAGLRVPADLEVVAHCNFPWPTPSVVPVRRLGYDAREVLAGAIRLIDAARDGGHTARLRIPARFEDELVETSP
jgi:DNA-binding LacI/PurR family transcriptional regulator